MEKEQFATDVTGITWMFDANDLQIQDLRRDLGLSFGFAEPTWFLKRENLDLVHDFINTNQSELFERLKEADTDERRKPWLESVVMLKTNPPPRPTSAEAAKSAGANRQASTQSPAAGAGTTTQTGASGGAQPARRSAFASKAQGETQSAAPGSGAAAQTTAPAGASGRTQTGRPSAFASKAQGETQSATPSTDAGTQTSASTGTAPAEEEQVGQLNEQITTVISELSPDELSAIASDLDLTPEEVQAMIQEPDFAGMVAEEQAHLGSDQ